MYAHEGDDAIGVFGVIEEVDGLRLGLQMDGKDAAPLCTALIRHEDPLADLLPYFQTKQPTHSLPSSGTVSA